eukprot:2471229-Rhodomonas_salina.1
MDLIWHTHLAWPHLYASDCMKLVGRIVGHDDSVNDRTEVSPPGRARQVGREVGRSYTACLADLWYCDITAVPGSTIEVLTITVT